MKVILAEPEIVTRTGQSVSVNMPIKDCESLLEHGEDTEDVTRLKSAASNLKPETRSVKLRLAAGVSEEETLKRGMEAKLKEFVEKGAEVYTRA